MVLGFFHFFRYHMRYKINCMICYPMLEEKNKDFLQRWDWKKESFCAQRSERILNVLAKFGLCSIMKVIVNLSCG